MMRLLHWVLAHPNALDRSLFPSEWGQIPPSMDSLDTSDIAFCVLFSDIGETIYRKCGPTLNTKGWKVVSPIETTFELNKIRERLNNIDQADYRYAWLNEEEAIRTWQIDSVQMTDDLSRNPSAAHRLCTLPSGGVAGYLNWRVTVDMASDSTSRCMVWGVRLVDLNGSLHFATWAPDPQAPASTTIVISRLRSDRRTFPSILKAVCHYALSQSLPNYERVEIWNLPEDLQVLAADFGGVTSRRTNHLDSIHVYGLEGEDVQWAFNER